VVQRRIATSVAVLLAALAIQAVAPGGAAGNPPTLAYACSPPPASCLGWYRGSVNLSWDWNQLAAVPSGGDCNPRVFTADTRGTVARCEVRDKVTFETTAHSVTIRIDKTAPSVSGGFARSPDWAGWFNHPVGFRFTGRDATSGVRSCSTGVYRGPQGAGVATRGTCRDVAGNVGARTISLNYDAAPPPTPRVRVTPGNRKVALRWSARGVVSAMVLRSRRGRRARVIFSGTANRYTDRRLRNGRTYRYAIVGTDRAGNRAVARVRAVPTSSKLLNPPRGARLHGPPTLLWKKVRRASYYNVQLYRGAHKVLSRWPRKTTLRLYRRWRYAGKRRRLAPGRYRWYVWPGYGKRSARKYGRLLGRSRFTVVR
jgi:hypothetical protein